MVCLLRSHSTRCASLLPRSWRSTHAMHQIAILNAASIIGRTIPNAMSDRVGTLTMLTPLAAVAGALIFVMFAATTPGAVIVFAILYGAFSGGCKPISQESEPYTDFAHRQSLLCFLRLWPP